MEETNEKRRPHALGELYFVVEIQKLLITPAVVQTPPYVAEPN
jgi:hypothetical protein